MKFVCAFLTAYLLLTAISCNNSSQDTKQKDNTLQTTVIAHPDNSIKLPGGFVASIFADSLGSTRHISPCTKRHQYR